MTVSVKISVGWELILCVLVDSVSILNEPAALTLRCRQ